MIRLVTRTAQRRPGSFWLGVLAAALTGAVALSVTASLDRVEADGCSSGCVAAYNQCRKATNGSSACDARFQACMRQCMRK